MKKLLSLFLLTTIFSSEFIKATEEENHDIKERKSVTLQKHYKSAELFEAKPLVSGCVDEETAISNRSKKIDIVLRNIAPFKFDLRRFSNTSKNLVLINNDLKRISEEEVGVFCEVIYIKDFSVENIENIIYEDLSKKYEIGKILTDDEYSVVIAAYLRHKLNLPGMYPDEIDLFNNKDTTKRVLKESSPSIRLPKYIKFDPKTYLGNSEYIKEVIEFLGFPIFAKPIDGAASAGTRKIHSQAELSEWLHQHASKNNYELDEFIEGELYHCDSIVQNGKVIFSKVSEYIYPCYELLKGKPIGSIIVPDNFPLSQRIQSFNLSVLQSLKMSKSIVSHMEIFKNVTDELVFVEVNGRSPGGSVVESYETTYHVNLAEAHFRLQMELDLVFSTTERAEYCGWLYFPLKAGRITSLKNPIDIKSQYRITFDVKPGQEIVNSSTGIFDVGCKIFLSNLNYEELYYDFKQLAHFSPYIME